MARLTSEQVRVELARLKSDGAGGPPDSDPDMIKANALRMQRDLDRAKADIYDPSEKFDGRAHARQVKDAIRRGLA